MQTKNEKMIKLTYEDEKTLFQVNLPVLVTHLNYGNHLGYDALLTLIQDARIFWLKQYNMSEASLVGNIGFVVKFVIVDYLSEAFHGDYLQITLYPSDIKRSSFVLNYRVVDHDTHRLVALAQTKQVFFNYQNRKPAKGPEAFFSSLNG